MYRMMFSTIPGLYLLGANRNLSPTTHIIMTNKKSLDIDKYLLGGKVAPIENLCGRVSNPNFSLCSYWSELMEALKQLQKLILPCFLEPTTASA